MNWGEFKFGLYLLAQRWTYTLGKRKNGHWIVSIREKEKKKIKTSLFVLWPRHGPQTWLSFFLHVKSAKAVLRACSFFNKKHCVSTNLNRNSVTKDKIETIIFWAKWSYWIRLIGNPWKIQSKRVESDLDKLKALLNEKKSTTEQAKDRSANTENAENGKRCSKV